MMMGRLLCLLLELHACCDQVLARCLQGKGLTMTALSARALLDQADSIRDNQSDDKPYTKVAPVWA